MGNLSNVMGPRFICVQDYFSWGCLVPAPPPKKTWTKLEERNVSLQLQAPRSSPKAVFTPVTLWLIESIVSPFLTDAPPGAGGDKPRAHLTGNSSGCVFQETMGPGPEISFSVCQTHSCSFKVETTPFGNRPLLSVRVFRCLPPSKCQSPMFLGHFRPDSISSLPYLLFLSFILTLSHSEMAFLRFRDSCNFESSQRWKLP